MLAPHQEEWTQNAERTIQVLNRLLEPVAVDIQHIGSTAIPSIHAKPIIDLVVGVRNMDDIAPYVELLKQHDIVFRKEDVAGQLLFVMGDFERTPVHTTSMWSDGTEPNGTTISIFGII